MTTTMTRRQLLKFFGAGGTAAVLGPSLGRLGLGPGAAEAAGLPGVTPLRLPHPLTIYTIRPSFLPTGGGSGTTLPATADPSLATYTVLDDVALPPELAYYIIVKWGDRPFANPDDYVGYNNDYTSFIPLHGGSHVEGLLWVNHEYVSFPFSTIAPGAPAGLTGGTFKAVIGFDFPTVKNRESLGEMLYNTGGSFLRIRDRQGQYEVQNGDPLNRRVHGLSGLAVNAGRSDGYSSVVAWGATSHQQGDMNYLVGTGPAALQVFNLSTDGLGNKIIGTSFNCSGGTSPWGTVVSCEENFQGSALFFVGVQEEVKKDGTQLSYLTGTSGIEFGQVGEKYGWIVEIDPQGGRPKKHTALGRFRHENIAMRARRGSPLCAYMGDDRRGGHVWRFVSTDDCGNPSSPENSALFEQGTLYVAHFDPDGTGTWIPLTLDTPTNPVTPTLLATNVPVGLRATLRNGLTRLPNRAFVPGQTDGGFLNVDLTNEATRIPPYQGKKLSDLYPTLGAILVDAYAAGNAVGGTPCARPEDLEVNPSNDLEVFIAFTDCAPGSDGHPDSRIFTVGKYTDAVNDAQQSGGLFKIIEDGADGAGLTFHWERLELGGEAGAEDGDGFANLDNLAFDSKGDVWGVIDMTTDRHNGFGFANGATTTQTIDHKTIGDVTNFVGVFGNNWLFRVPLSGPEAGLVIPVAYGPVKCEMTGPTFVHDTLIISVQHPGEEVPIGNGNILSRPIEMLKLDGTLFTQTRTVSEGSAWPGNVTGDGIPRPCVIGITAAKNNNKKK